MVCLFPCVGFLVRCPGRSRSVFYLDPPMLHNTVQFAGNDSPLHHRLFAQVKGDTPPSQKKRGRPRKDGVTGSKPIGRPRKFLPAIGDPIRFLQNASLTGMFKVNDENAHITGLSSFLNPNFRSTPDSRGEDNGADTPDSFSCQFCGKTYKKKKHYNRHINFECINTEPRFLCTMCSYRARRKEHLIRHLRSHIGDLITSSDGGSIPSDLEPHIGRDEKDSDPVIPPLTNNPPGILAVRQSLADWPFSYYQHQFKEDKEDCVTTPPPTPLFSLQQGMQNLTESPHA